MSGFPIRCYTCGYVIGRFEEKYLNLLNEGKDINEALNILKIKRYCCKRMFIGHVNIIDKLLLFSKK
jgi:DNA-directed RNA polymerase subunit N (RpoN/RPB10)